MTFLGLALCVGILGFAAVSALASLALRPVIRSAVPYSRTGGLFALRYTPTILAVVFTGFIVLPAFVQLEPRRSGERIGVLMIALAAASLLALLAGPLRGLRSALVTARLTRRWRSGAAPILLPGLPVPAFAIDEEFPLVALVGILRPRIYVARPVLMHCTASEMAAIVAHETAHYRRRDNLKRLLLCSCPDFLAFSATSRDLERAWSERCDRAADDDAARRGSRLDLAAALVKVARAFKAPAPAGGLFAAFSRGDDIASRVRRLLREAPASPGARWADRLLLILLLGAMLVGFVLGRGPEVRFGVYSMAESVVRLLQ